MKENKTDDHSVSSRGRKIVTVYGTKSVTFCQQIDCKGVKTSVFSRNTNAVLSN